MLCRPAAPGRRWNPSQVGVACGSISLADMKKLTARSRLADAGMQRAPRLVPLTQEDREWERIAPRRIGAAKWRQLERYATEIFKTMGMPLDSPGTRDTPRRFIRALFDATDGYEGDPKVVTAFPTECDGGPDCRISQIVQGPIAFHSVCEHHAFPFFGQAWVGYIAHERIIGISKLTRIVRLYSRRFTLQERVGRQIIGTLERILDAHGVAVYLDASHLC